MPSLSPSGRLADGFGVFLTAAALLDWDAVTLNTAAVWPMLEGPDMPTSPNRLVIVTAGEPVFVRATATANVQVRLRGAVDAGVDEVLEQAERIRRAFTPNGFPLVHATLGTLRVGEVRHLNGLVLSPDASRRFGHVQNYRVRFRP